MTGATFKTTYGFSQKSVTINASASSIKLNYMFETTVQETPNNTIASASFGIYVI